MAQLHDEHLTIEQLSAAFDKQLSPQEQAVFDAHISTCQQCQNNLADLRLTAALLRAMPEEAVPRSFVLPGSLATVPHDAGCFERSGTRTCIRPSVPHRSMRHGRAGQRRFTRFRGRLGEEPSAQCGQP